ncbi:hypothetical protein EYF80_017111 [Liparis tanakae]|uniref:Uncharacterized protein n=1 Tax=Liparis tanakae TaxID=230148 RepID=A0A4Z2I5V7_9TELE|nr:hypothetical protein EYF80_017111 [Liparis tanakae]
MLPYWCRCWSRNKDRSQLAMGVEPLLQPRTNVKKLNFVQQLYLAQAGMLTSPRCCRSQANTVGPPRLRGLASHLKPQAALTH